MNRLFVISAVMNERTRPVGIKAVGSSPRASGKAGLGEVDVPVMFGDVTFRPGDLLFSDEDGVVTLGADG